jgi:tRNA splicing ligase
MYGELYAKPWELHRMTFKDVMIAIAGLNNEKDRQYDLLYRSTAVITSSGFNAKEALKIIKKALPALKKEVSKEDLISEARKVLERNRKADDELKVKKILDGRRP